MLSPKPHFPRLRLLLLHFYFCFLPSSFTCNFLFWQLLHILFPDLAGSRRIQTRLHIHPTRNPLLSHSLVDRIYPVTRDSLSLSRWPDPFLHASTPFYCRAIQIPSCEPERSRQVVLCKPIKPHRSALHFKPHQPRHDIYMPQHKLCS